MEKNADFFFFFFARSLVLSFLVSRSTARTAMRGGRLVGGVWRDKREVIWHSDRVGRCPFFFYLISWAFFIITRPVPQVGGGGGNCLFR